MASKLNPENPFEGEDLVKVQILLPVTVNELAKRAAKADGFGGKSLWIQRLVRNHLIERYENDPAIGRRGFVPPGLRR